MAIVSLNIVDRRPYAEGRPFGDVGPYELWEGMAHFAVDPQNPRNEAITDLELAPRDCKGMVHFSADFAMLRPVDSERGKHRILFDVVNRGSKIALWAFNRNVPFTRDSAALLEPGDGFLMRRGYTVVWCGWQADIPPTPGLMGIEVPEALGHDGPLTGRIMCHFQANEPTSVFLLSDREHLPHPPVDPKDPSAILTVRDHPNGPAKVIDRDRWSFVRVADGHVEPEPCHIHLSSGFEPGRIYQLVYRTRGSKILGLGFAAVRDIISFLKYATADDGNPCAGEIQYAYAFGSSQSGRFLRQLLYPGMHEDEQERMALDGIIAHVAGGMQGEFNLRFGQPSKDVSQIMPELFPFTDTEQTDPETGRTGGLLARALERGRVPKVLYTNTSSEYWRGDAALIHTDLERMTDASELESVRHYHFAGTQHTRGTFPPRSVDHFDRVKGQLPFNSVDYTPLLRAALENLDLWVSTGKPAPPSWHPHLSDGTAVEPRTLVEKFSRLPGVPFPPGTLRAMRLDFGPEVNLGRVTTLPPIEGKEYPALVSHVDEDCNEIAGIRLPDLAVPVATYTGWNLRHPDIGNPHLLVNTGGALWGWTLPFPTTRADRETSGDPRLSIEERYSSREDYLHCVREAARVLVDEGYMLDEDVEQVVERAALRYDSFSGNKPGDRNWE